MRPPASLARSFVVALIAVLGLATLAPRAHAQPSDARAQAKAAFGRATAAEERKDWRTAIREYLTAYDLAPHPDVLYNVASVYERLEELRSAATYYRRYLDESEAPADRDRVERLIASMKQRASRVTVRTTPAGATILVDGAHHGRAPRDLRLPGGRHEIVAEHDGMTARQTITLEYAEPAEVELVLGGDGRLVVSSNEAGATVLIDGAEVGATPWNGTVAAGRRQVVVRKEGFTTVERTVQVPPGGTAQITASMVHPLGFLPPTQPSAAPSVLVGGGAGAIIAGEVRATYELLVGYRPASRRWDAWTGVAFGGGGVGYALGARLFVLTGSARPYLGVGAGLAQNASHARAVGGLMLADLGSGRSQVDFYLEGGVASAFAADAEPVRGAIVLIGATWHLNRNTGAAARP